MACDSYVKINDIKYFCSLERYHSGHHKAAKDISWTEPSLSMSIVNDIDCNSIVELRKALEASRKAGQALAAAYKDCKDKNTCPYCGEELIAVMESAAASRKVKPSKKKKRKKN